jgi:hypothetical protein
MAQNPALTQLLTALNAAPHLVHPDQKYFYISDTGVRKSFSDISLLFCTCGVRTTQMCISYTQCTVRLCQLHSQTLKPSFLRPPHTVAACRVCKVMIRETCEPSYRGATSGRLGCCLLQPARASLAGLPRIIPPSSPFFAFRLNQAYFRLDLVGRAPLAAGSRALCRGATSASPSTAQPRRTYIYRCTCPCTKHPTGSKRNRARECEPEPWPSARSAAHWLSWPCMT